MSNAFLDKCLLDRCNSLLVIAKQVHLFLAELHSNSVCLFSTGFFVRFLLISQEEAGTTVAQVDLTQIRTTLQAELPKVIQASVLWIAVFVWLSGFVTSLLLLLLLLTIDQNWLLCLFVCMFLFVVSQRADRISDTHCYCWWIFCCCFDFVHFCKLFFWALCSLCPPSPSFQLGAAFRPVACTTSPSCFHHHRFIRGIWSR